MPRRYLKWSSNKKFCTVGVHEHLTDSFHQFFDNAWTKWSDVPKSTKDEQWARFLTKFFTKPSDDLKVARMIWNKYMFSTFTNELHMLKNNAQKKEGVRKITESCKKHHPNWMDSDVWNKLIDLWIEAESKRMNLNAEETIVIERQEAQLQSVEEPSNKPKEGDSDEATK